MKKSGCIVLAVLCFLAGTTAGFYLHLGRQVSALDEKIAQEIHWVAQDAREAEAALKDGTFSSKQAGFWQRHEIRSACEYLWERSQLVRWPDQDAFRAYNGLYQLVSSYERLYAFYEFQDWPLHNARINGYLSRLNEYLLPLEKADSLEEMLQLLSERLADEEEEKRFQELMDTVEADTWIY